MDFTSKFFHSLQFLLILSVHKALSLGINYGQLADNLPSPDKVVPLAKSIGATKLKLYDADPDVLTAFANTDIEFMVCISNQLLPSMKDPKQALSWIKTNIQPHLPATKITTILVGNEILSFNDAAQSQNLLPAMQSVHAALVTLSLDSSIAVTTPHSLAVMETSFPPSAGKFRADQANYLSPILNFNAKTGSPFLINAYPYFAYKADPRNISLDFVLFEDNQGVVDNSTRLVYKNMLFAQIDAVYAAVERLGFGDVAVHISETGWPSRGDEDEVGATPENARKYNGNLMTLMGENDGTPMRPGEDLNVFVFALFNEDLKPGPTSERNYGLFKPDGTAAYQLAGGGGGVGGGSASPAYDGALAGYMSFSFAEVRSPSVAMIFGFLMGLVMLLV